jgi:serine/threonine-protein kinase HipA
LDERTLFVHLDVGQGPPVLAARLTCNAQGGQENASLEIEPRWREHPMHAVLAPLLMLPPGPYFTGTHMPLFGAIGDCAPDRWGRTLLRRHERDEAAREGRAPRVLREADLLLGVEDTIRAGNLRFALAPGGPFQGHHDDTTPIPGVKDLARLARAVKAFEADTATRSQRILLLQTGQLLGGSRPKATVRDNDGSLLVAKFATASDTYDQQRWEALALGLARDCGIEVPEFRLAPVEGERVLLLRRFDRERGSDRRIPFITMLGLLNARDNKSQSYLDIAEVIRRIGARPLDDLAQLWRRALFAVLISDKDNHLRNHGMVLHATGWRIAPAYDLNAEAEPVLPRVLAISLDGVDDRALVSPLLAHCADFGLALRDARTIARDMAQVVRRWREHAQRLRLPEREVRKLAPAFEHESLRDALRGGARL